MQRDGRGVPIWVTKEGREIPIDAMEMSHLENAIRFLQKRTLSDYGREKLRVLILEKERRNANRRNGVMAIPEQSISGVMGWERRGVVGGRYQRGRKQPPVPTKLEVVYKGKMRLNG